MAPASRRQTQSDPQSFNQLGVRGRKTGVDLKDTGVRDEHGLPPLEGMFSDDVDEDGDETQGEEDMDIENGTAPSLSAIRRPLHPTRSPPNNRPTPNSKGADVQVPDSSPPVRATTQSSTARKLFGKTEKATKAKPTNPRAKANGHAATEEEPVVDGEEDSAHDAVDDSPVANTIDESMQMINGHEPDGENVEEEEQTPVAKAKGRPKGTKSAKATQPATKPARAAPTTSVDTTADSQPSKRRGRPGRKAAQQEVVAVEPEEENEPEPQPEEENEPEPEPEEENEPEPEPEENEPEPEPEPTVGSAKKRGRPARKAAAEEAEEPDQDSRQAKRQKTTAPVARQTRAPAPPSAQAAAVNAKAKTAAAPKTGVRGRPKKQAAADVGDESIMAVQRGPPMPKNRGLVSARPDDKMIQTRSGRNSFKPLQYWRNEKVVLDDDNAVDDVFQKGKKIVLPSIKGIVRVEEEAPPTKKRSRPAKRAVAATKRSGRAIPEEGDMEEYEDWEVGSGTLSSQVLMWDPSYQLDPPGPDDEVEMSEEQIAVSGPGVEPREIRDSEFRFVKTLTLPFLGTGIVDLPSGAEKKSKNSRRMHLVFFVFFGKIAVTVHDFEFRISAGGTFFVPRGNYYSMRNDYDQPARLFFAQGNEVEEKDPNETVMP